MKQVIICILLTIGTITTAYSQSNRYTKISTSSYSTSTPTSGQMNYYQAMARKKAERIGNQSVKLYNRTVDEINGQNDKEFKKAMFDVQDWLRPIFTDKYISIDEAEKRLNKANRKFNRAVRKYNRRLKKMRKT